MDKKIGDFTVEVWEGGYPIWVHITHKHSDAQMKFSHNELADLEYAVACVKREIARQLPDKATTSQEDL